MHGVREIAERASRGGYGHRAVLLAPVDAGQAAAGPLVIVGVIDEASPPTLATPTGAEVFHAVFEGRRVLRTGPAIVRRVKDSGEDLTGTGRSKPSSGDVVTRSPR